MKLALLVVGSILSGLGRGQDVTTPTDAELLSAFQKLDGPTQKDAVDWFGSECRQLPTYQRELVDFVLRALEQDQLAWPVAPAPKCYDSAHHTPGQVIPRRFVDTTKGPHANVVERMLRKVPKRELEPSYVYDWGLGTVVAFSEDPLRIARNAVRGIEPRVDLIESIVAMQLDGGQYRDVAKAFSHVYADREGNAYRELTLYDAWASGADMEMPDVECLGIVHDLENDWKRWVAPVPPSELELRDVVRQVLGKEPRGEPVHVASVLRHRERRAAVGLELDEERGEGGGEAHGVGAGAGSR